jgi:hypothetical protein
MFREHRPYRGLKQLCLLLPGLVAATILAISSAISCNAGAATVQGVGSLSPVVGYWRRQYRRANRRGYYGYGYPYYGYGYGMAMAGATRLAARSPKERLVTSAIDRALACAVLSRVDGLSVRRK